MLVFCLNTIHSSVLFNIFYPRHKWYIYLSAQLFFVLPRSLFAGCQAESWDLIALAVMFFWSRASLVEL